MVFEFEHFLNTFAIARVLLPRILAILRLPRRFSSTASAPSKTFSLQFGCHPEHSRCRLVAVPVILAAVLLSSQAFLLQFGCRPKHPRCNLDAAPGISRCNLATVLFLLQFGCRPGHSHCSLAALPRTLATIWQPPQTF